MSFVDQGDEFGFAFAFESYGVTIQVKGNDTELLEEARRLTDKVLLGNLKFIENSEDIVHRFVIGRSGANYLIGRDGDFLSEYEAKETVMELFVRLLRLKVSEYAQGWVFVHAGAVAWKGRGIIIPANSGKGKTTLVAELAKLGAEYYSDEYAVFDAEGNLHPFARELSIKGNGRVYREKDGTPIEALGGFAGEDAVPVGLALLLGYDEKAGWDVERLTVGNGVMETIPHTIPFQQNANFSLNVLKNALSRAIILRGSRGDAAETARKILDFCDSNILARPHSAGDDHGGINE
jgi:hypothetical protein